jgi:galactonate dehydratase
MRIDRRAFAKSLAAGTAGSLIPAPPTTVRGEAQTNAGSLTRSNSRLPPVIVTKIRAFYPPNYNPNGPQAFPQSNMVILVDTDAGITGVGQGGSPDLIRNISRSVIGKNALDTEYIWQAVYMDGFYSPGKERLHGLGGIDLALWDIKGKALNVPLYQLFGGRAREHIELYATNGLPPDIVPAVDAQRMGLKERAAAAMAAGYRVFRVDSAIVPSAGRPTSAGAAGAPDPGTFGRGQGGARGAGPRTFDSRAHVRLIVEAAQQIRDGVGQDGNWMIDLHQSFDFQEAVDVCNAIAPMRPFCAEDPLREEQFRTQLPKLRLMTNIPLAAGEEWGTRADFSPLVENRDIDFARASLPNVGGITEMLKIMAVCDTHKVGIMPHFTSPIGTAGHLHTMMAFPGQVLMEYNYGERPVDYLPEFLECRNGKVWPNDRPGLGVTVDVRQLTFIEEFTTAAPGPTYRRPDGSLSHW